MSASFGAAENFGLDPHQRAQSVIETTLGGPKRPFNEELPAHLKKKVFLRRHGAPAVFKNYKRSLSILSKNEDEKQTRTFDRKESNYDYDIGATERPAAPASAQAASRAQGQTSSAFGQYRQASIVSENVVAANRAARSRTDLMNEGSKESLECYEGGTRDERNGNSLNMQMINNARMQDFLTMKVGSCGKETKL